MHGDVVFTGDVVVEGRIHGDLQCTSLLLAEGALISGSILADKIVVCGRVDGSIHGQSVTLKPSSNVQGDISHQYLMIEKGAVLRGLSRPHDDSSVIAKKGKQKRARQNRGKRASAEVNFTAPVSQTHVLPGLPEPEPEPVEKPDPDLRLETPRVHGRQRHFDFGVLSVFGLASRFIANFAEGMGRRKIAPPEYLLQPRKPEKVRHFRLHVFSPLLNLSVIASAALLSVSHAYDPAPAVSYPLSKTVEPPTDRELILLDANGKPFARRGGCLDAAVTFDEIPDHFVDALLATEDRRFFSHFGIDPIAVARAAMSNYSAGKIVQGGSTITQQLAKISYLTPAKSFERKVKEAIAVFRLEGALDKEEILERYLSRAYFGEGCFGLRAAARYYFKRGVADLTIPESAMLVALLKAPTHYSQDSDALERRENHVLSAMVDNGQLNKERLSRFKPAVRAKSKARTFGAYYADWIADTTRIANHAGQAALPIRTSFDPKLQRTADNAVKKALGREGRRLKAGQAAVVVMRRDGRVLAMVGGKNYRKSQFNRASHALRQPGSSFKLFVYLAAMRAGGRPDMQVVDEPITIGDWSPKNYNGQYQGVMPLKRAFSSSINTISVRLTQALGPLEVATAARDLGITTPISNEDPSIALGTPEVTLLELTSAYAAVSANAYPVKPWGVISLADHKSEAGGPPSGSGRWKLMEGDAMRQLLQATVQAGTGRAARLPIPAYGKTGTSQNYRDAWFIGFAGNLVVGVWVGNDDNSPMNRVTGGNLPARIWQDFMTRARRIDRNFKVRPSRVAAFKAVPQPRLVKKAQVAGLKSILLSKEKKYARGYSRRDQFGNAMLLGSVQSANYPRRRAGSRRYRIGKDWDPFVTN